MWVVEALVGTFLVLSVLLDVFQSIVTPRPVGAHLRLSRYQTRWLWPVWRFLGTRVLGQSRREGFLGSFGPFSVLLSLGLWILFLVIGYGLLDEALSSQIRPQPGNLATSVYFAGTSLMTIGFGDYVPVGSAARFLALLAGATGLGTFALVVTYLFSLLAAFQRREVAVVATEASAGAPASGVQLLESFGEMGDRQGLGELFSRWQDWSAEVLDSHLSYPVLTYFRSSHDNDSWIGSLGAVMDAATLVLTTIEDGPSAPAKRFSWVGGHCIEDMTQYFGIHGPHAVGVELEEYREARQRLEDAGWQLRSESDGWQSFQRLRARYASQINAMARLWASPPAQWIGDRSPVHGAAHEAD